MKFKLTKARRHPLQGLEVTDEFGVAYLTHTKRSVLEAGAVMFLANYPEPCPYQVIVNFKGQEDMPDNEWLWDGTDDPETLTIARAYEYDDFPSSRDWTDIPLNF